MDTLIEITTVSYTHLFDFEKTESPDCYTPNDSPYPLCKGNGSEKCEVCCWYENMKDDGGYSYYDKQQLNDY